MTLSRISKLSIKGFKNIQSLENFEPKNLNILIGANGAGKSNFIGFFRMLSFMFSGSGNLQEHLATRLGGADSTLFDGKKVTQIIEAYLEIETEQGFNEYQFKLSEASGDKLIFILEQNRFSNRQFSSRSAWYNYEVGQKEADLLNYENKNPTATTILRLLQKIKVYQFHDTSAQSRLKSRWNKNDNRFLKEDGANLAPFLWRLRTSYFDYYKRVIKYLQVILPFFDDFVFDEDNTSILLKWHEKNSDMIFNASQASDGMLRTMALITLLAQPPENLPHVMLIDEPELGLHPYAIDMVSELIQNASHYCQIFLATQSQNLVANFEAENIVVVNRKGRASTFERLDSEKLKDWLAEYSLIELWDKNVIGGRPL